MRGNLLDVLRLDYVTTARAKGLDEGVVIFKHALRNALNPMITLFGYTLGALVSGSFVAEIIFSWPGLGRITLDAILTQDQYLVMGSVLMASRRADRRQPDRRPAARRRRSADQL